MFLRKSLYAVIALLASPGFAGPSTGGGGDVCEDRIKIIREDIQSWISNGGSTALSLPLNTPLAQYNTSMLNAIGKAQVSCTGAPVKIGNAEKACKNFQDGSGVPQVVCNRKAFLETNEDGQYVLVHHEYAGLAGIEVADGEDSKYPISNQISGFLENALVKRLVVKSAGAGPLLDAECVSRIVIKKSGYAETIRGPSYSMRNGAAGSVKVAGYPRWSYKVAANENGSVSIHISLLARNYPDGLNSSGVGFPSSDSYAEATAWLYKAMSYKWNRCHLGAFRVVCAATKEIANAAADTWANGPVDPPRSETVPNGCIF